MDYTYYLFAGFVFLLVCAVIYLNNRLKRDRVQEQQSTAAKPVYDDTAELLMSQYRRIENAMRNLEDEIKEASEELDRQKKEGAALLAGMEHMYNEMQSELANLAGKTKPKPPDELRLASPAQKKKPGPKKKTTGDRVKELYLTGLSSESIAQELKVSRGEVDLVLGMHKKQGV